MILLRTIISSALMLSLAACGGGGGSEPTAASGVIDDDGNPVMSGDAAPDPLSDQATYTVLVQNYWSEEDFPQGYPDDAHLSLFGGAVHNEAVSFWSLGEPPTAGIEDMAETGRIDILLADEVRPAVENGTADSAIEVRVYTDAPTADGPGELTFDVQLSRSHPLVSMVSMLGPSPDWFVGVDSLSLQDAGSWVTTLSVDLPLYDAGSKSNMTPIMHGPGISPPNPIAYVGYDAATGVYLPRDEPQLVARLTFTRIK